MPSLPFLLLCVTSRAFAAARHCSPRPRPPNSAPADAERHRSAALLCAPIQQGPETLWPPSRACSAHPAGRRRRQAAAPQQR